MPQWKPFCACLYFSHCLFFPLVPPQFVDFPLDVEVDVGESVQLICSAEGSPIPIVSWSRQEEGPIVPSGTTEIIGGLGSNTVHMKSKAQNAEAAQINLIALPLRN